MKILNAARTMGKRITTLPSRARQGARRKIERVKELQRKHAELKQEGLTEYVPFSVLRGEHRRLWKRALGIGAAKKVGDYAIHIGIGRQMIREGFFKELWGLVSASEKGAAAGRGGALLVRGGTFALITLIPDFIAIGALAGMSISERKKIKNAIKASIGNPQMANKLEKYYSTYPPINELLQKLANQVESNPAEKERIANAAFTILSVTKEEELRELKEMRKRILQEIKQKGYSKEFKKKAKAVFRNKKNNIVAKNPFTKPY